MKNYNLEDLIKVSEIYNYPIFRSKGKYDYNLNIWGIRSNNKNTADFNDSCAVFFESKDGTWNLIKFKITTDPSDISLLDPINDKGTAIVKPGHYKSLWVKGYHKGRKDHPALIQHSPITVYRDNNKDDILDLDVPTEPGIFGINMHRASKWHINIKIGLYGAGCQVHYDVHKYDNIFIPLIDESIEEGLKTFSYTLIEENDIL